MGIVKFCPGGEFSIGAKVAAVMGGLDRAINSSYAEYARARVSNGALIESDLSNAEPWRFLKPTRPYGLASSAHFEARDARTRSKPMSLNGCAMLNHQANKCFTSMI
jgi:hypothetical protein